MRFYSIRTLALALTMLAIPTIASAENNEPLGPSGAQAVYHLAANEGSRSNSVRTITIQFGRSSAESQQGQWLALHGTKFGGAEFTVWVRSTVWPQEVTSTNTRAISRYILQEGHAPPHEFVDGRTGAAVMPVIGGWNYCWPNPGHSASSGSDFPSRVNWLGHAYELESVATNTALELPANIIVLRLRPDVLVGVPSTSRTRDNRRRFDGSDYEMVRLTRENFAEMIDAGLNCLHVDAEQAVWIKDEPVYYWGLAGNEIPFPECLYRSTYLGPSLFIDEPAVGTRDYDIRPRLGKDPAFRRTLTPQIVFDQFKQHYLKAVTEGAPVTLIKALKARTDLDVGALDFQQPNIYSWETMVATGAWELSGEPAYHPRALVFEPPGRIGTRRTLPEMNMVYGCQIPPENPANLTAILFGLLRGAARASEKDWGVSIYGGVDQADAPYWLTHAYDLGATHFFFWDNYQSACVPYAEYLALARHLREHVARHPERSGERLRKAAEAAILLPPGYNLGHVQMGRGNLWGLGELNLERTNGFGVTYRTVMGNFFAEIERAIRLGVDFDLVWDLPNLKLDGYREIVRIREDGRVEIRSDDQTTTLRAPRLVERPAGTSPTLTVTLTDDSGTNGRAFTASAVVTENSAPAYYTNGTNRKGIFENALVLWELFGPNSEDYRQMYGRVVSAPATARPGKVELPFSVEKPGHYRLRAATTDVAGRSAVVWTEFDAGK